MGFGLVTGFIAHFNSWLHFTSHYHTQVSVLCHAAWQLLSMEYVPLFPGSRLCRQATISCQPHILTAAFMLVLPSAASSMAKITNLQLSVSNFICQFSTDFGIEVTLQLKVSQSVCQGIEPTLELVTRYYFLFEGTFFLKVAVFSLWGALSDERSGLSFVFLSPVIYYYLQQTFTLHVFYSSAIYIQYIQASFSLAWYSILCSTTYYFSNYRSSLGTWTVV
jgi:hypothetical protein